MKHHLRVPTKEQYAYIESEFDGTLEEAVAEYRRLTALVQGKDDGFVKVETFTGETILWNAELHEYRDLDGKKLLSGSAYKKSLEKPFDLDRIAPATAKKYGVAEADIKAMWEMNSFCSTRYGDSLHKAMELYRKFGHLAEKLGDKEYFLPKNGTLRKAVLAFPEKAQGFAELMISAVDHGMVGQIDWLTVTGEKSGIVEDYKSDMDIAKTRDGHMKQLSFYAHILIHHGWTIEKVRVWNWTGEEWKSYDSEVLPLEV